MMKLNPELYNELCRIEYEGSVRTTNHQTYVAWVMGLVKYTNKDPNDSSMVISFKGVWMKFLYERSHHITVGNICF